MDKSAAPRAAFVSTNSITQGEQVGVLWGWLLGQGVHIHFAHRTFAWSNEARGKAAVHCVIIGFGLQDRPGKLIYEYEDIKPVNGYYDVPDRPGIGQELSEQALQEAANIYTCQ